MIFIEPLNSKYHPFIVEWRHLNHLLRQIDSPYFCSFRVSSKPHRLLFGKTKLIRERFRIINCDLWLLGTISSLSLPFFWLSRSHYLLQASYKLFYAKRKVGRGHSKTTWKRFWQFLTTYLPTSTWTFFTLNVDKKKHFLTTYPPHLVHVVF